MKLGVCFLTYNACDVIGRSLASCSEALKDREHEIVVVDNASADGTVEEVRKSHPEIHLIRNEKNLGYSAGNNVGGRYLLDRGCGFLAFVNPDVFLLPDTLATLEHALCQTPDAGCAGGVPRVGSGDGLSTGTFRNKPGFLQLLVICGWSRYLPVTRNLVKGVVARLLPGYYARVDPALAVQPVYAVSGACIMFPAASFQAIGGFDEYPFLFLEELIVSERLGRVGQKVIGVPQAVYLHAKSSTVGRYPLRVNYHYMRSERYVVRKYFRWPLWKVSVLTGCHALEFFYHVLLRSAGALTRGLRGRRAGIKA